MCSKNNIFSFIFTIFFVSNYDHKWRASIQICNQKEKKLYLCFEFSFWGCLTLQRMTSITLLRVIRKIDGIQAEQISSALEAVSGGVIGLFTQDLLILIAPICFETQNRARRNKFTFSERELEGVLFFPAGRRQLKY
jgi:hypothetical protein